VPVGVAVPRLDKSQDCEETLSRDERAGGH
jgi:hypothetical protein